MSISLYYYVTLCIFHSMSISLCFYITLLLYHSMSISLYYYITLSLFHSMTCLFRFTLHALYMYIMYDFTDTESLFTTVLSYSNRMNKVDNSLFKLTTVVYSVLKSSLYITIYEWCYLLLCRCYFFEQIQWTSQRILTMFVGVVALCYQHHTTRDVWCWWQSG